MKRSSGLKIDLGRVGRSFNAGLTMERFTIDLSLPNFITIGLIALLWYGVVVGGASIWINGGKASAQ